MKLNTKCKRHTVCRHFDKKKIIKVDGVFEPSSRKKKVKSYWQYTQKTSNNTNKRPINRIKRYDQIMQTLFTMEMFTTSIFGNITIYDNKDFFSKIKDSFDTNFTEGNFYNKKMNIDSLEEDVFFFKLLNDSLTLLYMKVVTQIIRDMKRSKKLMFKLTNITESIDNDIFHNAYEKTFDSMEQLLYEKRRNKNIIPNYIKLKEIYFVSLFLSSVDLSITDRVRNSKEYHDYLQNEVYFEKYFFLQSKCSRSALEKMGEIIFRILRLCMDLYYSGYRTHEQLVNQLSQITNFNNCDTNNRRLPYLRIFTRCVMDVFNIYMLKNSVKICNICYDDVEINFRIFQFLINSCDKSVDVHSVEHKLNYENINVFDIINSLFKNEKDMYPLRYYMTSLSPSKNIINP